MIFTISGVDIAAKGLVFSGQGRLFYAERNKNRSGDSTSSVASLLLLWALPSDILILLVRTMFDLPGLGKARVDGHSPLNQVDRVTERTLQIIGYSLNT